MSDEPSSVPDLAAIDLSLSFAPAWAKEADSSLRISKLAEKHGGGDDRPQRSGKGRGGWDDRGPRQDRKPPRREGGPRPGGGDRPPRRDGRRDERHEERRPVREVRPEPAITGWEIQFRPDSHGVDGLARQIKTSAKAYPLFDLARLVLEKSERYLVEFKRSSDSATALFQLKADGSLWLTEGEAIAHALATQLDKFYRRERVTVDPPKGVYSFVAVCGMSGTLLGPPNYHDYQTKLIRLHAEKFANMSFDAFKSRIRMERDESFIEKWKEEQSSKDVFFPIDPSQPAKPEAPAAEAPAPVTETAEPTSATDSETSEPGTEPAAVVEAAIEDPTEETVEPSAEAGEAPASEPEATEEGEAALKLGSLAEVEEHFREHHASKIVVRIRERVVVPGPAALNDSAPAVLRLTRGLWEELDKFPLPLAHSLGQQIASKGLQIFKTHDNITYVGVARPRHLDVVTTPVSEGLRAMLEYIEAHRAVPRAEQWRALVDLRPLGEGTEAQRETAVAADLFWLLREGHVVDYAKRGLEATRRPKPQPVKQAPKKPKPAAVKPSPAAPTAETPVAPIPVVPESVSETPIEASVDETPLVALEPAEPLSEEINVVESPVAEMPAPEETPAEEPAIVEEPEVPVAEAAPTVETDAPIESIESEKAETQTNP